MKQAVTLLLLSILFTSCAKQIIIETQSNKVSKRDGYVYENDTVRIVYNFWSSGGKMSFEIWNKLDVPLFIDWKNSAFIENGVKYDYWIDKTITNRKSIGYYDHGFSVQSGHDVSVKNERITFIPPHTKVIKDKYAILMPGITLHQMMNKTFDANNSAVTFRNYIALSMSESLNSPIYIDNNFYISKVFSVKETEFKSHENKGDFWLDERGR